MNFEYEEQILSQFTLDSSRLNQFAIKHHDSFVSASPFPNVIIDDFFPQETLQLLCEGFKTERTSSDVLFKNGYAGTGKRQIAPDQCLPLVRYIFYQFNSSLFLEFLEKLTGINSLIGDPYFEGGGLHEISKDGRLGVHTDFLLNRRLNLLRRLNVIIYLNHSWSTDYGGNLELWDKEMKHPVKLIQPTLNRCVIFETNTTSYHGHPEPLKTPGGITRKSLALYYYNASDKIIHEHPSFGTNFVPRPEDPLAVKIQTTKIKIANKLRDYVPPVLARQIFRGYRD